MHTPEALWFLYWCLRNSHEKQMQITSPPPTDTRSAAYVGECMARLASAAAMGVAAVVVVVVLGVAAAAGRQCDSADRAGKTWHADLPQAL